MCEVDASDKSLPYRVVFDTGSSEWCQDDELVLVEAEVYRAPVASTKSESQLRKEAPMFSGFIAYFPDAIMEAARLSRAGNEKHNPGQPMHWSFGKSNDHNDCVVRHMVDFDEVDPDNAGLLHAVAEFWRAGSNLQTLLEKRDPALHTRRQAQRDRAARGER